MKLQLTPTVSIRLWARQHRSGQIIASSPDLPGLYLAERSWEALCAAAREVAPILIAERRRAVAPKLRRSEGG